MQLVFIILHPTPRSKNEVMMQKGVSTNANTPHIHYKYNYYKAKYRIAASMK